MNAIDLLVTQHRQMEAALEALLDAPPDRRLEQFLSTADLLMAHVIVEETRFYPAVRARRTEDILLESLEEHLSLKRLVADLLDLPADDRRFEPKLHVLEEQARHHHHEEEDHLFPKVRNLLSEEELGRLGRDMLEDERVLLQGGQPRERAREQTAQSAPLR